MTLKFSVLCYFNDHNSLLFLTAILSTSGYCTYKKKQPLNPPLSPHTHSHKPVICFFNLYLVSATPLVCPAFQLSSNKEVYPRVCVCACDARLCSCAQTHAPKMMTKQTFSQVEWIIIKSEYPPHINHAIRIDSLHCLEILCKITAWSQMETPANVCKKLVFFVEENFFKHL